MSALGPRSRRWWRHWSELHRRRRAVRSLSAGPASRRSCRAPSVPGAWVRRRPAGVSSRGGGAASLRRARMVMREADQRAFRWTERPANGAEWTPWSRGSRAGRRRPPAIHRPRRSSGSAPSGGRRRPSPPTCAGSRPARAAATQSWKGAFAMGLGPVAAPWLTAQGAGFARENRHMGPRVVDGPAAPEDPLGLAGEDAVLPDDDPPGIGLRPGPRTNGDHGSSSTGRPTAVASTG